MSKDDVNSLLFQVEVSAGVLNLIKSTAIKSMAISTGIDDILWIETFATTTCSIIKTQKLETHLSGNTLAKLKDVLSKRTANEIVVGYQEDNHPLFFLKYDRSEIQ